MWTQTIIKNATLLSTLIILALPSMAIAADKKPIRGFKTAIKSNIREYNKWTTKPGQRLDVKAGYKEQPLTGKVIHRLTKFPTKHIQTGDRSNKLMAGFLSDGRGQGVYKQTMLFGGGTSLKPIRFAIRQRYQNSTTVNLEHKRAALLSKKTRPARAIKEVAVAVESLLFHMYGSYDKGPRSVAVSLAPAEHNYVKGVFEASSYPKMKKAVMKEMMHVGKGGKKLLRYQIKEIGKNAKKLKFTSDSRMGRHKIQAISNDEKTIYEVTASINHDSATRGERPFILEFKSHDLTHYQKMIDTAKSDF